VFTLIEDIESKKITNLQPYKDLSFSEAKDRYDNIRIFDTKQLIKIYKNGWKWIDVGNRCQLVGKLMKNCGSAGVMSWDEDKTILTLFDKNNKPHVVVTYSPNEKRISGDEGAASTEVKGKYHRYILDLAEHLGVKFDAEKSKSKSLKIKSMLRNRLKNIKKLRGNDLFSEYYEIVLDDGKEYYSDGYSIVAKNDVMAIKDNFNSLRQALGRTFNYRDDGAETIRLSSFAA
jgi:hypothetical protein